jgi:hypothetical protein
VVRWLVALAVLAGCQIDARSSEFRCEAQGDCGDGRDCVEGWCVVTGLANDGGDGDADGPTVDAQPPDAFVCPPTCTECTGGRCVIRCDTTTACAAEVVCPAGVPCTVECSAIDACGGGVDCSTASDCEVECTAMAACGGAITCGAGPCLVRCTAIGSCGSDIDCDASCACDVECTGTGSCAGNEDCPGGGACDPGQGCTSAPNPCHDC